MGRQLRSRFIEVAPPSLTTNNRQLGNESAQSERIPDSIPTPEQITAPAGGHTATSTHDHIAAPTGDHTATSTPDHIAAPAGDPTAIQGSAIADCETRDAAQAHASDDPARYLATKPVSEGGVSNNHDAGGNQATDSPANPTLKTTTHGHHDSAEDVPSNLASCSTTQVPDAAGDLDTIMVDSGPALDENIYSQESIIPDHLDWMIDGDDFSDENKTLNDDIIHRPLRFQRGDPILKRLEQRQSYHVRTINKVLYRLTDQVETREHAESLPKPASYDEFLSSELAATSTTMDVIHFLQDRVKKYRKELSRARHQLRG
ncbi:hypothetical protein BDZ45DRAFT_307664 [Acephala macrosclerotiorum]|nr:hypothetical protein BDZ45DRAFT_307664 [Acephala macrosclerotiorum]